MVEGFGVLGLGFKVLFPNLRYQNKESTVPRAIKFVWGLAFESAYDTLTTKAQLLSNAKNVVTELQNHKKDPVSIR